MTQPRRLLAGTTHSATRRVAGRKFLLKPTEFVNDVVRYALGYAASRHPDVLLHGFMAESNHHHTHCTDSRGSDQHPSSLPRFFAGMHRMVAAALNTHYGRGENFWASGSYDNVEIHSQQSIGRDAGPVMSLECQFIRGRSVIPVIGALLSYLTWPATGLWHPFPDPILTYQVTAKLLDTPLSADLKVTAWTVWHPLFLLVPPLWADITRYASTDSADILEHAVQAVLADLYHQYMASLEGGEPVAGGD